MKHQEKKLDEHTWIIEEYDDNVSVYMYLLEGEKEALLIDTGLGAIPLYTICKELTDRPIRVALTHGHVDHIGGTGAFNEVWLAKEDEVLYHVHSELNMRNFFTKEELFPVKGELLYFTKHMVFELGKRTVEVIPTPGHSVGSVCFLDKERRWLFTGDTCCKAHVLLQMEYASSISTYRESIQCLWDRRQEYDITWPGHHDKPVKKQIIKDFLEAADGILNGTMEGKYTELPMGKARLLEYREIGIEY